jgi:O-antigen/teichoic acid export membrane protein
MVREASGGREQLDLGSRASVARNAFHLVVGQVATTALAIVFSAALGRSLGPKDFGLYFLINSFSTFAYVVADWGQQFYVVREVARTPENGGRLLGTTLALRIAGSIFIALPAGLVAWGLGYDARTCWFSVAFIAATVPWTVTQSYLMMFRGRERMALEASVSVANKIATLLLALPALALGTGIGGVVLSQAVAGLVAFVVAARLHRRIATGALRFDAGTARQVLAGGTAIVTMMIAASIQPYLDAIILSKLVPGDAVGWYGAAKNIMGTLIAPSLIIGAAAYPRLSRASVDLRTFGGEVRATLRPMLFLGALAAVGTWLFADLAIALVYGQRNFGPAGMILKVFAPGLFLLFIDVLFGNALTALGRSTAFSVAKVASVALSTGLDLVLIPWFQRRTGNGGIGAVLAFVVSEVVVFGGSALFLPAGCLGAKVAVDLVRALAAGGLTALVFQWLPPLPIYVGIPACVATFTLCALALGLVRRTDLALLQTLVQRRAPASAIVQTPPGAPAA